MRTPHPAVGWFRYPDGKANRWYSVWAKTPATTIVPTAANEMMAHRGKDFFAGALACCSGTAGGFEPGDVRGNGGGAADLAVLPMVWAHSGQ